MGACAKRVRVPAVWLCGVAGVLDTGEEIDETLAFQGQGCSVALAA